MRGLAWSSIWVYLKCTYLNQSICAEAGACMKIQTEQTTLESFFSGLSTRYRVPTYQRNYSWTSDEIEQLWNDLTAAFDAGDSYFVGTLVLNSEQSGESGQDGHYDIVDGQQRLTTISIIFSAMRNIGQELLHNNAFESQLLRNEVFFQTARRISNYAEDRLLYRSEPDHYYLELNARDQPGFESLVQKITVPKFDDAALKISKSQSRLVKAKKVINKRIYERFIKSETSVDALYRFLVYLCQKLQFIKITVETDYDAYLLFESLNSKGLELSTADLVKNKLLAACRNNEERKKKIVGEWDVIVSKLERSRFPNPVDFLRCYWHAFEVGRPTKRDLYKAIRSKLQEPGFDVESFVSDLSNGVDDFVFLTDTERVWPSQNIKFGTKEQYIAELNSLRYAIHLPVMMIAIKTRTDSFVTELIRKSLSFLFRLLTIGDYTMGIANAAFSAIQEKLKQASPQVPDEQILAIFDLYNDKVGDEIFEANFAKFVTEDNSVCRYILTKIHLHNCGVEQIPKSDEIHLEHILPQDSSLWEEEGFDSREKQLDDLKYSIGNMTLLDKTLNSSISNNIFSVKVARYQMRTAANQIGTTFPMTYEIYSEYQAGETTWTKERIERRAENWANLAVNIWAR
jgi:uncharacterized protein with ParB-like and HNH nuclease domain